MIFLCCISSNSLFFLFKEIRLLPKFHCHASCYLFESIFAYHLLYTQWKHFWSPEWKVQRKLNDLIQATQYRSLLEHAKLIFKILKTSTMNSSIQMALITRILLATKRNRITLPCARSSNVRQSVTLWSAR